MVKDHGKAGPITVRVRLSLTLRTLPSVRRQQSFSESGHYHLPRYCDFCTHNMQNRATLKDDSVAKRHCVYGIHSLWLLKAPRKCVATFVRLLLLMSGFNRGVHKRQ